MMNVLINTINKHSEHMCYIYKYHSNKMSLKGNNRNSTFQLFINGHLKRSIFKIKFSEIVLYVPPSKIISLYNSKHTLMLKISNAFF
jgi:hypothetical protein